MGKKLAKNVHVGGEVYGPGSEVPDDVAEQITNPKAWEDEADEKPARPARSSAKKD